jgi:LytS/YehU family sensor histidine kinase
MKAFSRQWLLVFGVWTVVGAVGALADLATMRATGLPGAFATILRVAMIEQWIWAALTPAVFLLAGRVPLKRGALARGFTIHLAAFLTLSSAHCALSQWLGQPFPVPSGYRGSIWWLRLMSELYTDIWMYWPLVGIRALIDAQARVLERERQASAWRQSATELRLSLLRAQIQPHFLFNTLHAISALLKTEPEAADDMVSDLADILRVGFSDAESQYVCLRREMALVDCYLRIQERRFPDRLAVVRTIDRAALQARLPALLLQSLVENAVAHGIAPLQRRCRLRIGARQEGRWLRLEVCDDGTGMPDGQADGVGLRNTRERLIGLFGADHRLAITSARGLGTKIEISLPYAPATGNEVNDDDTYADRGRRTACAPESAFAAAL